MIKKKTYIYLLISIGIFLVLYFLIPNLTSFSYDSLNDENSTVLLDEKKISETEENNTKILAKESEEKIFIPATHIKTPEEVKAIYMSSWVAGTNDFKNKLIKIIDDTELNAVVIDIKDSTGKISFEVSDPILTKENSVEKRIPDIHALLELLHSKNIYVIGRIAVFQDPHFIKNHPNSAVKTATNKQAFWKDRKGISWIDPSSKEAWEYMTALAKESHALGFDEINFDYIRFPSDGNMKDIYYPLSEGKVKTEVMKSFYEYLNQNLKKEGIVISADLFGMTATNTDDLNIGQILEDALVNFDFVAPMVYPSHFPKNWNGYSNPNTKPYEVIKISMGSAVKKAEAIGESPLKLRPWLQDFNMGATYTPDMVRAQIKATYDVGLNSWMLWDPANTYTKEALENK